MMRRCFSRSLTGWAFLLFLCGPLPHALATPPRLQPVTLQLKWQNQFQFAGYYAAVEKGYYRQAGLDVTLREARPGEDPVTEVLMGRAQYGVGTSELLIRRSNGDPVVMLAAIFQHSPLVLLARGDRGIDDLQQLHDRPIMMEPQSAELFAYFQDEGVDPVSLHLVPHSFDVRDLISGKVAAMSAYITDEPYALQQAGIPAAVFTPRAGGIDFYGDNLFTTEEEIRRHPARARAFREASLRGWDYAMAHPNEIVDDILSMWKTKKTRDQLIFEAAKTAVIMDSQIIEVGHMNPGRWRHIADTYAQFGMIPAHYPLDGFLYDPSPHPLPRWIYGSIVGLALATFALVAWLFPLLRLNRRLRREVELRRRHEAAAEAANEAKGRYVAVMSHEIRSSLTGIQGLAGLTRETPLPAETGENLRLIETTAERLLRLIENILDYTKLDAGRLEAERTPVALEPFLHDLCRLFQVSVTAKRLAFTHSLDSGVPPRILSDPMRLRQVLSNLLSNAIKFTPAGSVTLVVHAERAGDPRERIHGKWRLRFEVRDTGIGIPAEALARLFQPFAQASPSTAREYGGSGLGLAISQNLAGLLGGAITVESQPGQGTSFTLEIVTEEPPAEAAAQD
jgi:signal transduction histidine kinase/ABC-type nitrate/sulfonate/bicarbonate transport system substrate-binding protein